MNETIVLDNRIKILKIREVNCELENLKEIVEETLQNPDGKYSALVKSFRVTLNDAQKCLDFITKLMQMENDNIEHKQPIAVK